MTVERITLTPHSVTSPLVTNLFARNIVRVRNPADFVGVKFMVAGEIGRTPAVDWVANILKAVAS